MLLRHCELEIDPNKVATYEKALSANYINITEVGHRRANAMAFDGSHAIGVNVGCCPGAIAGCATSCIKLAPLVGADWVQTIGMSLMGCVGGGIGGYVVCFATGTLCCVPYSFCLTNVTDEHCFPCTKSRSADRSKYVSDEEIALLNDFIRLDAENQPAAARLAQEAATQTESKAIAEMPSPPTAIPIAQEPESKAVAQPLITPNQRSSTRRLVDPRGMTAINFNLNENKESLPTLVSVVTLWKKASKKPLTPEEKSVFEIKPILFPEENTQNFISRPRQ
jgi:hypothetical protein